MTAPRIPLPTAPAGVFTAAMLLAGAAAFWLSATIATLFAVPQYGRFYENLHADHTSGSAVTLLLITSAVPSVLVSLLTVLLAVLDARGRPVAWVLTYIVAGLSACVSATYLLTGIFTAVPWHQRLMTAVSALTLVIVVTVAVLLSLRSSRRYLRAARLMRQVARPVYRPSMPYGPAPYPPPRR
jgi:hypothetical protein